MSRPGSAGPQPGVTRKPHDPEPKGWYSRGYLPHFDSIYAVQSITFRLEDSIPQEKLRQLENVLKQRPTSEQDRQPRSDADLERRLALDREQRQKIEEWLDAGMGCCALKHPRMATVMVETLKKHDPERYRLIAWCVMPNDVHVLIAPKASLFKIVQSWKSYTGRWAMKKNAELGLGVPGRAFWMREYWDRYIRDERHFQSVVEYIHMNPVKAGLCREPQDWPWSSAHAFLRRAVATKV
jgi:type I restriction enzyme R subunit/putative DNA methylase